MRCQRNRETRDGIRIRMAKGCTADRVCVAWKRNATIEPADDEQPTIVAVAVLRTYTFPGSPMIVRQSYRGRREVNQTRPDHRRESGTGPANRETARCRAL